MRLRKLGKLAPRIDKRTLKLADYVSDLPAPPPSKDWTEAVQSWPVMLNAGDGAIGDCAIAAAGHLIQGWTANAGTMIVPADNDILAAYETISGYNPATGANDIGCSALDALNYWRNVGIGGHQIGAYVALEPHNHTHVMDSICLFGGCYIGLNLPESVEDSDFWSVPIGGLAGDGAPGSWGGHAVCALEYDPRGLTVVTWGELIQMTWGFWDAYCDEAYAILSLDWMTSAGQSPSGFDLGSLKQDLNIIG